MNIMCMYLALLSSLAEYKILSHKTKQPKKKKKTPQNSSKHAPSHVGQLSPAEELC